MIYIMRGIPGSGKSYHANKLARFESAICSADNYFRDEIGVYKFIPAQTGAAHQFCFRQFMSCMHIADKRACIVVDNTNIHLWECSPYVLAGQAYGHDVELVYVKCDVETAIARNTHGVPESVIRRMAQDFELPLAYWRQCVIEN